MRRSAHVITRGETSLLPPSTAEDLEKIPYFHLCITGYHSSGVKSAWAQSQATAETVPLTCTLGKQTNQQVSTLYIPSKESAGQSSGHS